MTPLLPDQPVPPLEVPLVGGGRYDLGQEPIQDFAMIVVYRGLHCPICKTYLRDLERRLDEYAALGVSAVTLSMDPQDRAEAAKTSWGLERLRVGYGLPEAAARRWGLYLSTKRPGTDETALFAEPGLFLVRPDQRLFYLSVQSMPFGRPSFAEMLPVIDYMRKNNYPARGTA